MSKAIREVVAHHSPIITVGELIDELCRLPDTAFVRFRCPLLDHELTFHRLRRRPGGVVEFEISTYPESPPVAPSTDGAVHAQKRSHHPHSLREGALLHKGRG
ncbi:hypothetical protein [Bradyrhizobium liaoningense]|uniref:hypothetical protein n=1 Tax=Bradyrhizobium liaoningense TaxID=43992 RepID=UPI001BA4815E|nr:hypothetical protein [Bradyrhizobium liaoningense]MBR0719156.1 hypothetical protein [Bradyrhizobium liaoningense]